MSFSRIFLLFLSFTSYLFIQSGIDFLNTDQRVVLGVLCIACILWVSETVPLYVTAVLSSVLLFLLGNFSFSSLFSLYIDPIIILFLGGFVLARGLQRYELDQWIAIEILHKTGTNPKTFLLGMMGVTAFLSLWMSNTASAAIMVPICVVVLQQNNLFKTDSRFAKSTLLSIGYAATLGGIGSLIGSSPNAISAKYLTDLGQPIGFVEWMTTLLPFVLLSIAILWLLISFLCPPNQNHITFHSDRKPLNITQKKVFLIFGITVLGWLTSKLTGLSSANVALFPILSLFILRLLGMNDLKHISWGTLLLFGGGLGLGMAVSSVGLDMWFIDQVQGILLNDSLLISLTFMVFFGIFCSALLSNTATAAILTPLALPLASKIGVDASILAFTVSVSVSLDFMMPVGTPPNAIVYSTQKLSIRDMMSFGAAINVIMGCLLIGYLLILATF